MTVASQEGAFLAPAARVNARGGGKRRIRHMGYQEAVKSIWHHREGTLSDEAARLKEIVRYATLAPSGHNTQCWRFRIENRSIAVQPDLSRRTPVVDPDDHHLYASLGCAAENLTQAAEE